MNEATKTNQCVVKVRFFAGGVQAAGIDEREVTVNSQASVAQTVQMAALQPIEKLLAVCSYLVNGQLESGEKLIADLREPQPHTIDVLPPFAGG